MGGRGGQSPEGKAFRKVSRPEAPLLRSQGVCLSLAPPPPSFIPRGAGRVKAAFTLALPRPNFSPVTSKAGDWHRGGVKRVFRQDGAHHRETAVRWLSAPTPQGLPPTLLPLSPEHAVSPPSCKQLLPGCSWLQPVGVPERPVLPALPEASSLPVPPQCPSTGSGTTHAVCFSVVSGFGCRHSLHGGHVTQCPAPACPQQRKGVAVQSRSRTGSLSPATAATDGEESRLLDTRHLHIDPKKPILNEAEGPQQP